MKEFELNKAIAGARLVTRDGREVTNFRSCEYPFVAMIDEEDEIYSKKGLQINEESELDLLMADDEQEQENIPQGAKPFDLDKALDGAKLITRDGRSATAFRLETNSVDPVCCYAIVEGLEREYFVDGTFWGKDGSNLDLFLADDEQEYTTTKPEAIKAPLKLHDNSLTTNEYQRLAEQTAVYPDEHRVIYPTLGLTGESGEVADKIKKILRDKGGVIKDEDKKEIAKELGDVLWYIAILSRDLGYSLDEIAKMNIDKLQSRQQRGKLNGSGDNR